MFKYVWPFRGHQTLKGYDYRWKMQHLRNGLRFDIHNYFSTCANQHFLLKFSRNIFDNSHYRWIWFCKTKNLTRNKAMMKRQSKFWRWYRVFIRWVRKIWQHLCKNNFKLLWHAQKTKDFSEIPLSNTLTWDQVFL